MHVSGIFFTLVSALAVSQATKINMHCSFAADHTGMIQQPYCCRDLQPARHNPKANQATDCMLPSQFGMILNGPEMLTTFTIAGMQLKKPQLCEDKSRPACCYTIVSRDISSLAEWPA